MVSLKLVDCEETTCAKDVQYTNAKAISDITKAQPNCSSTGNLRPQTLSAFQAAVRQICIELSATWAHTVRGRHEFAEDVHAADAIYHQVCSTNFRTSKQLPSTFQATSGEKRRRIGRPIDTAEEEAFINVTKYLEDNDDEQITIRDIVNKMRDMCEHDINV